MVFFVHLFQPGLIFQGKQLSDQEKVQDYKLTEGNTLHLVMRQTVTAAVSSSLPGTCESPGACGLSNMGNWELKLVFSPRVFWLVFWSFPAGHHGLSRNKMDEMLSKWRRPTDI